ncbi:hypothetical protein [Proteus terrae]|uniref:hypothetical protein n=1 Tax=Proteus terrae TaxID=1574161 RepID=UPI001BACB38D|nr:hypothetical protein [Proteus terrae]QUT02800.1 hypothetical protein KF949_05145 [Proteus terrae subsp. cibarius]
MEFKHTPAPWKYTIRNANEIMTTFHGVTIGDVYLDITTANQKADSHLIAVAPELLEALIEIVEMQSKNYGNGMVTHMQLANLAKKAKIVIAKALGQQ